MKERIVSGILEIVVVTLVLMELLTPMRMVYIVAVNSFITTLLYRMLPGHYLLIMFIMFVKVYFECYFLWHNDIKRLISEKLEEHGCEMM